MKKNIFVLFVMLFSMIFSSCQQPEEVVLRKQFAKSTVVDGQYSSTYTGLTSTLSTDWFLASEAEREQYMGIEAGTLTDENDSSLYSQTAVYTVGIYDAVANNIVTGATMAVLIENQENISADADLTVDDYLKWYQEEALTNDDYIYEFHEKSTVTIQGQEYTVQPISYRGAQNKSLISYQLMAIRKQDDTFVSIKYTNLFVSEVSELTALFA